MENLIFRKVEFENLDRFKEIFFLCFGIEVNVSYFEWKYKSNPDGEVIAFEAYDNINEKVAAFYGIMPEKYKIDGVEHLIYQSMDTMTHPDYRNKGLFIKLANMTYDYVKNENKNTKLIGIPGSNSFYGFVKKLAWYNPLNISYTFTYTPLINLINLFQTESKFKINEVDNFNENVNSILDSSSKKISKHLSADILNWKFVKHPLIRYKKYEITLSDKLISFAIVEISDRNIKIVINKGLEGRRSDAQFALLSYLSKKYSNHFIYTWKTEVIHQSNQKYFMTNPFSKGLFSYRVPFITLDLNENHECDLWSNAMNFDLYPGIQD